VRRLFLFPLFLIAVLVSGCGTARPKPGKGENLYTVRVGDTLGSIAQKFGTDFRRIAEMNDIDDPDEIEEGAVILVPTSMSSRRSSPYTGGQILWPVDGGNLISKFGPRDSSFHDGLDIAATTGTDVFAAHDGIVVYSDNELGGYGELIIIKSSSSLVSVYAHNSRRLVKAGSAVKKGDRIAEVGETGKAEGPHLHFEVRIKDPQGRYVAVDPLPLLEQNKKPSLRYRINESLSPIIAKISDWRASSTQN